MSFNNGNTSNSGNTRNSNNISINFNLPITLRHPGPVNIHLHGNAPNDAIDLTADSSDNEPPTPVPIEEDEPQMQTRIGNRNIMFSQYFESDDEFEDAQRQENGNPGSWGHLQHPVERNLMDELYEDHEFLDSVLTEEEPAHAIDWVANYVQCPTHSVEFCEVCQEDTQIGEKIARMRCMHAFHRDCLKRWLDEAEECPSCRTSLV